MNTKIRVWFIVVIVLCSSSWSIEKKWTVGLLGQGQIVDNEPSVILLAEAERRFATIYLLHGDFGFETRLSSFYRIVPTIGVGVDPFARLASISIPLWGGFGFSSYGLWEKKLVRYFPLIGAGFRYFPVETFALGFTTQLAFYTNQTSELRFGTGLFVRF